MITLPGGKKVTADSTGKQIAVGDSVRFRGQNYRIKAFGPLEANYGVHTIIFDEPCHTDETPHECNVDRVSGDY